MPPWRCASPDRAPPVVIADTQDNPGAGGNSDTTGMLRALVRNDAQRAAIGLIVDPAAAEAAHAAGVGASIRMALGGQSGIPGDAPFKATFTVEALSDGQLTATGPFYGGSRLDLGPSACLRIGGVRIVVASRKTQMADQEMYRFVGIEPRDEAILVNKSSVHFRADFEPIADQSSSAPRLDRCPSIRQACPGRACARASACRLMARSSLRNPSSSLRKHPCPSPRIEAFAPELTAIRHDLHAHPEIGFEEVRTAGIVAAKLESWGIETHRASGAPASSASCTASAAPPPHRPARRHGRAAHGRDDQPALPLDQPRPLPRLRP